MKGNVVKLDFLLKEEVNHRAFGQGIVESIVNNLLEVKFEDRSCKFTYPSCFYGFLTLVNKEKQEIVDKDIAVWHVESGTKRQEELDRLTSKTQEGIKKREYDRQQRRIEKAKEEAQRSRFFAGLDNSSRNK